MFRTSYLQCWNFNQVRLERRQVSCRLQTGNKVHGNALNVPNYAVPWPARKEPAVGYQLGVRFMFSVSSILACWMHETYCHRCFGYAQGVMGGLLTVPAFLERFPQVDTVGTNAYHNAKIQGILKKNNPDDLQISNQH